MKMYLMGKDLWDMTQGTETVAEEAGQYRVAGLIEKPVVGDEEVDNLKHEFIRSDVCMSKPQAEQITLQKCKLFIDQVGDNMFK